MGLTSKKVTRDIPPPPKRCWPRNGDGTARKRNPNQIGKSAPVQKRRLMPITAGGGGRKLESKNTTQILHKKEQFVDQKMKNNAKKLTKILGPKNKELFTVKKKQQKWPGKKAQRKQIFTKSKSTQKNKKKPHLHPPP